MISNVHKYNDNLQNVRQLEIEQVHNFAEFRAEMETRWQRQMDCAMQSEMEIQAQAQKRIRPTAEQVRARRAEQALKEAEQEKEKQLLLQPVR